MEHRTLIGFGHSDLGENLRSGDDVPGAIDTDGLLWRDEAADLNQVSQGARRKFSIDLIRLPVNWNAPTLAASVFASGANAAKPLSVFGVNESTLGQLALLRIGTKRLLPSDEIQKHKSVCNSKTESIGTNGSAP
jgi:hypothetical protein